MMTDAPAGRSARIDILHVGCVSPGTTSTCTLVRDADRVIVFDPGMVDRQADILEPLASLGLGPADVTDVVLSHHHPDHCLNAGLFPRARVHDHWAIYRGSEWESVDAEGRELTPSVRLIRVPGHTPEDIALVAGTGHGVAVLTHLWWTAEGPADDPYAPDPDVLHASRARVLELADLVIPGHGPAFAPGDATPP
jgi:glyoxylase-like metal-dependent hydrolase (beta-lactamase superfamily II)